MDSSTHIRADQISHTGVGTSTSLSCLFVVYYLPSHRAKCTVHEVLQYCRKVHVLCTVLSAPLSMTWLTRAGPTTPRLFNSFINAKSLSNKRNECKSTLCGVHACVFNVLYVPRLHIDDTESEEAVFCHDSAIIWRR